MAQLKGEGLKVGFNSIFRLEFHGSNSIHAQAIVNHTLIG